MKNMWTTRVSCSGCQRSITERFMLFTDNKYWHCKGCLRCDKCGLDFGESKNHCETLYFKSGMYLCKNDYQRLNTGDKYVIRSDGEGIVCWSNCGGDARGRKRAIVHKK
ncbi:LIM domain transcription factor LMO4.1-like protein [Dinothrombium tinctorium]|uniref:LIM domain transcription factor LMO4.1-like protein n=1 Tax=Dinothrombium tinctorium TaxID=1965070 RepID=A0A443QKU9_9ACAR|nr:LIM domain transcription factor LMO4.1-like protein [Dinothrombium tinctorium]